MTTREFLDYLDSGREVEAESEVHMKMRQLSQEAGRITFELNGSFHDTQEIKDIMKRLTGRDMGKNFRMALPFYTDCGKNTVIGDDVFINSGCHFQDQGGIVIGNGVLIGPKVVIATLNHDPDPEKRDSMIPSPVRIGNNVWIGANATILPGVTVGEGAVVAAGAVVCRDVESRTVVGGVPAKVIKRI